MGRRTRDCRRPGRCSGLRPDALWRGCLCLPRRPARRAPRSDRRRGTPHGIRCGSAPGDGAPSQASDPDDGRGGLRLDRRHPPASSKPSAATRSSRPPWSASWMPNLAHGRSASRDKWPSSASLGRSAECSRFRAALLPHAAPGGCCKCVAARRSLLDPSVTYETASPKLLKTLRCGAGWGPCLARRCRASPHGSQHR